MSNTKRVIAQVKEPLAEQVDGTFTGYAAIFGNVDSYGDVIVKGAFAESLTEYGPDGAGIPCYWSHEMRNPMLNIGVTTAAQETDRGLLVEVKLDIDHNPNAAYVHRLIREKRVRQMSFAFDVLDGGWGERDGEPVYELRKLRLHEVSVVQIGANQETELLAAKARQEADAPVSPEKTSGTEPDAAAEAETPETGGNPAVVLANTILKTL